MNKVIVTLAALMLAALVAGNGLAAGTATKRVAIVHVMKGCHVWSVGTERSAAVTVALHRGSSLTVVNQDLDMHMLVQVAGPRIGAGAFMMMNQRVVLRFSKSGVYRFHTKVADMRGMPEAKTMGPDNRLVLTVRAS